MQNVILTATQALQLAAIGPCFFLSFYLLSNYKKIHLTLLPALYFVALAAMFVIPVLLSLPEEVVSPALVGVFIILENMIPELSFLLVMQVLLGGRPPWFYWAVLAIPLIGGAPFIYLSIVTHEVCLVDDSCFKSTYLLQLYRVFGGALVFMLLLTFIQKFRHNVQENDISRRAKYWLIIAIVVFNLLLLAVDLLTLSETIDAERVGFIKTMIGVTFVYLVLSSVFRVFSESFGMKPIGKSYSQILTSKDEILYGHILELLEKDQPYRTPGFNRRSLSEALEVKEYQVSKVINQKFKKSFSEVMNAFRVEAAKVQLEETQDSITAVSFDTGFSSLASFNRVFKEQVGASPSDYRKKHTQDT
jgi:AraC-like DNA-binding protein